MLELTARLRSRGVALETVYEAVVGPKDRAYAAFSSAARQLAILRMLATHVELIGPERKGLIGRSRLVLPVLNLPVTRGH